MIGQKISDKEMEISLCKVEMFILENGMMEIKMDKVSTPLLMVIFSKGIGNLESVMEKEYIAGQMEKLITETGRMIKWMDLE